MTSASVARQAIASMTLAEFGLDRLRALCEGLGASSLLPEISPLFTSMVRPWGQQSVGDEPAYASNVSDDEAPFEFSVALSKTTREVQFYLECLGHPPSLASNMASTRQTVRETARSLGAPLDRFELIADLLLPSAPGGRFTLWTGISCMLERPPLLKVYLNPAVRGPASAEGLLSEAMERLGHAPAWSRVRAALGALGARAELGIMSLDISNNPDARVKVYVRHVAATANDVQAFAKAVSGESWDEARRFYASLSGAADTRFSSKPVITEVVFSRTAADALPSVTLEFPIGDYVSSDQQAVDRISHLLSAFEIDPQPYRDAVRAFATRPLADRRGIHAHVTFRRSRGEPRIGVYLASEAYVRPMAEGGTHDS